MQNLVAEFMSKSSARALNIGCVQQLHRPPFALELPPR
jgi:hypothetical protein